MNKEKKNVLIIDDENTIATLIKYHLKKEGYNIYYANNGELGLEMLGKSEIHLVLQDVRLPGISGLELLRKIKEFNPGLPVIMMTAYGGIQLAVNSIKEGAYDFLTKPINPDILKISVKNAIHTYSLEKQVDTLQSRLKEKYDFSKVIGNSPAIEHVLKQVKIVAPTQLTVILQGESGSGKELFANLIHQNSTRKNYPFVAIDCGAIPDTLVESELFGYEKGAFTGAHMQKQGEFEIANKGTIFLDEITNLPHSAQAKLLRVIQERKVRRVGGTKPIEIDVRIIVATNIKLTEAVKNGNFREDLFHRLNEFFIAIPPLRERKEDIPLLAEHFLREANKELNKKVSGFSPESLKILMEHQWFGNIREFKNTVRKAVLLTESDLIPPQNIIINKITSFSNINYYEEIKNGLPMKEITSKVIREIEKDLLQKALLESGGNKSKTAKILQIDRMTLYSKLKEYNLL